MRLIPLTRGQYAMVDDKDYGWLSQWNWHAHWFPCAKTFYAMRGEWNHGDQKMFLMHREILGLTAGDLRRGDHKNRNGLDNQRRNIRIATCSQNLANSITSSRNKSGFKGVSWAKRKGKWRATINLGRKQIFLGYFGDPREAHGAYVKKAAEIYGEFARAS